MLVRYYQEARKIAQLIELGSISALREHIHYTGEHDFDSPQEDVTIFYSRDRGEQLSIQEYDDIPSWIADMEEYAYLWNGQEWLVNDHGEMDSMNEFPIFSRVEDVVTDEQRKQIGWED